MLHRGERASLYRNKVVNLATKKDIPIHSKQAQMICGENYYVHGIIKEISYSFFGATVPILFAAYFFVNFREPIKIGILHSLSGSLALSEKPMVDAELMAIEEINKKGGILKRKIVPVIADGKSDETIFAQEAERLIKDEHVAAIIGCWTSASRKAVKTIVEKYNNLLIYPVSYEGIEESSNILYIGANQNQQIIPAVMWSYYNLGKKFFLVGSDYIYSRVTNEIIKATLASIKAEFLGEDYLLLGSTDVASMIDKIIAAKPDVIINTIQGESNLAFFNQLRQRSITPEKIPIMSISSVSETEFVQIGSDAMAGDYVTASYFQSIDREENGLFVAQFKNKFGADRVVSEAVEAGYIGVHIWAQAVKVAHSAEPKKVKEHLFNRVFNAPSGIVYTDNKTLDLWKMVFVGKLRSDGQFTIVWDSKKQIKPLNYPVFKNKTSWDTLISNLYEQWGKKWSRVTG